MLVLPTFVALVQVNLWRDGTRSVFPSQRPVYTPKEQLERYFVHLSFEECWSPMAGAPQGEISGDEPFVN